MMDTQQHFFELIRSEYASLGQGKLPQELLDAVSGKVSAYYFEQYRRFFKQYPKAKKRYSSFQLRDLDHPKTYEIVIKTLKEKMGTAYEKYAIALLKMDLDDLRKFEKNREAFYGMF